MPTIKRRLNITLTESIDRALSALAKRDDVPQATKAADLLTLAIETEEDALWDKIASARDISGAKFVSHKKVWA